MKTAVLWAVPVLIAIAAPASAAIWPDQLGGAARTTTAAASLADKPIWDEYGLEASEQAQYRLQNRTFSATAFRLKDPTGAFGAFEWQRPANARPSKLADLAAETADGVLLIHHNYLLQFTGWKPQAADLKAFYTQLRNVNAAAMPRTYLPGGKLAANSARYILGPAALAACEPRIPASVAAFDMGSEAEFGVYNSKSGPIRLAVFSYPTPQIAIQRLKAFQQLPGVAAKRSGPLVAVVVAPTDAGAAEQLLSQVQYQATITQSERVPTARDNIGDLILNICILAGIVMGIFLISGLVFGFLRSWIRWGKVEESMIVLHLEDRR